VWRWIKNTFLAGLLVLAPITITIIIFYHLFKFFDGLLTNSITGFIANKIGIISSPFPGLGIIAIFILIIVTGAITRNYFGKRIIRIGDSIVSKIPLINTIYITIREISEAIFSEKREVFKKTVLIEYPRKELYSIAFFTQDTKGIVQKSLPEDVISVFIPTTPNPTSGYLLFVPKKDVIELDMSVEDALKLIISGGSIHLKKEKLLNKKKK